MKAETLQDAQQILVNTTVDGILSILFAVMIIVVIADATRLWFGIVFRGNRPEVQESVYEESRLDAEGREVEEREPVGAR